MLRIYPLLLSCVAVVFAGCSSVEVYQEDDYDANYDYICSNEKTVTLTDNNGNTYTIPACYEDDVIPYEEAPQKMTITHTEETVEEEPETKGFWSSLWGSSDEEETDVQEDITSEPIPSSETKEESTEIIVAPQQPVVPVALQSQPEEECIVKMYDYDIPEKYVLGEKKPKTKHKKQIMLEDLNTRMIVFCRGTEEQMEACAENMTYAGYVRISAIPKVTAKYDVGPQRGYPARRWREGDVVPRW